MKKWLKAALFLLPLLCMVAVVNWYVDSYAYLRVTYDQIGEQMAVHSRNVAGLEESDFNDRNLLLACLRQQREPKELIVAGSSRVMNFDHTMFGTDSFYNAGLSESTIYDLLATVGILEQEGQLPETMIIGADAFLFNASHNNDRWRELEEYAVDMERELAEVVDTEGQRGGAVGMEGQRGEVGGTVEQFAPADAAGRRRQTAQDGENAVESPIGVAVMEGQAPADSAEQTEPSRTNTGRDHSKWLSLDYFRYNVTLLPQCKRFDVAYTQDWESEVYLKHYDGSIAYQRSLREVDVDEVAELTNRSIEEQVVYRMTDFHEIDERSMGMLAALTDYLQGRGVKVILYLPPYSPMMYNYIESAGQYQITFRVEERLRQMAVDKNIALYGSYDPAGCGLEMTDLYDIYHVKTEKMMDTFYPVILAE